MENRSSHCGSRLRTWHSFREDAVWSPGSLSGLRIQCCYKLQRRSQTQLGSFVYCCGCGAGLQLQLIQPLAQELPYATSEALKRKKKKKELLQRNIKKPKKNFLWGGSCTHSIHKFPGWGWIRATAASLCHSHRKVGSEPRRQPTPQLKAMPDP